MKILILTHVSPIDSGGVATSARHYYESLNTGGHEIMWLHNNIATSSYDLYHGSIEDLSKSRTIAGLEVLASLNIHVTFVHYVSINLHAGICIKKILPNTKLILNFRGNDALSLTLLEEKDYSIINPDIHQYIFVSEHLRDVILSRYCIPQKKCLVIRNGISSITSTNRKILKNSTLRFGAIGFWKWKKGLATLIEAVEQLKPQAIDLEIVGKLHPSEKMLSEKISDLSSKKIVRTREFSFTDDKKNVFKSYDVVIIPSLAEGVPNVLLEAISDGCYIIGSNIPGIKEVIEDCGHGILFRAGDCKELKNAILNVTSHTNLINSYLSHHDEVIEKLKENTFESLCKVLEL